LKEYRYPLQIWYWHRRRTPACGP